MESKICPHVLTWRSIIKKQLPILLWVALMVIMTGLALLRAVPAEKRVLFSD